MVEFAVNPRKLALVRRRLMLVTYLLDWTRDRLIRVMRKVSP